MALGQNAIANLLGTVNANGALLVALDGGTATGARFLGDDGTAAAPTFSFSGTGDGDNGMYLSAADTLGWSAGGTLRLSLSGTALTSTVPALLPLGSASAPALAFSADATTGVYNGGAQSVGIAAAGVQRLNVGTTSVTATVAVARSGANGQLLTSFQELTELTTIAAAATTDTTIQMPANSVVLGVSVRVTTVIPTANNFTVGDSGSAARFSTAAVSSAANSTDPGTKAGSYYNASALSVRITPDLTPAANTGRVRVTIHYYSVTPPTS